jgi:carbon monoxide dehydrogenase subunit G
VVNGRIKVKVGPVSLTYKGTAKFTERDPEAHVVVLEAAGKETRGAGTASANVRASMVPGASGSGTDVTMHTTMNVTGRPAQFGRGVMVEVGSKLVEQFAGNLAKLITGDMGGNAGSGDGGGGAPAEASTTGATTGTGSAGASTAGAGSAGASADGTRVAGASAPAVTAEARAGNGGGAAAGTTTVPVAHTSAPAQEDSLNLIKLVGPVLLKRLVPVAAGAAVLALLGRLFWRLRRRGGRAKEA